MSSEFEYLILSVAGLGEETYGAAMREVIETRRLQRARSLGSLLSWSWSVAGYFHARAKYSLRFTISLTDSSRNFHTSHLIVCYLR